MKIFKYLLMCLFLFSFNSFAINSNKEEVKLNREGQIVLDTILNLEKEGYLTERNSKEAQKKYVFDNLTYKESLDKIKNEVKVDQEASFFEFLNFVNVMKFLGVVLIIIAFFKYISRLIELGVLVLSKIPLYVYQFVFVSLSLIGLIKPEVLVSYDHFYVAFFCSFSLWFTIIWIFSTYEVLEDLIEKLSFNHAENILLTVLTLYFGALAIVYESQAFGFLSIASLVSLCGFIVFQSRLTFYIGVQEDKFISPVILSTLLILGIYSYLKIANIDFYQNHFRVGIEHLCSFALGVTLFIAASPYSPKSYRPLAIPAMLLISFIAFYIGNFYNLAVVSSYINTMFVLWIVTWLSYLGHKVHTIFTLAIIGISLYCIALLIEKFPEYFVTALI